MPETQPSPVQPPISARKADHLDLCTDGDVAFRDKTTLFEDVEFLHDALPELAVGEVDLTTTFAGKVLKAPLVIAAMTGGVDRAIAINRDLASVAEELGIGFAFGSQRPLLAKGIRDGYEVRDVAPNALVVGNIGIVQAASTPTADLAALVETCAADALAVHLNPAMEVVQPEGDDDFRHGLVTLQRLVNDLPVPIVVKETGCGLSRSVGKRLVDLGVQWVDTSGAGGTSWVAVEMLRAADEDREVGITFRDWGLPTAASVAQLSGLPLGACATGGMKDGLMVAKAIALGATCGGIARPFLQAHARGGRAAVLRYAKRVIAEIRVACLLTGSRTPAELQGKSLVLGTRLRAWVPAESPLRDRMVG